MLLRKVEMMAISAAVSCAPSLAEQLDMGLLSSASVQNCSVVMELRPIAAACSLPDIWEQMQGSKCSFTPRRDWQLVQHPLDQAVAILVLLKPGHQEA